MWADVLDWVSELRRAQPALDQVGRARLDLLVRDIGDFVKQQAAWEALRQELASQPEPEKRLAAIDAFVRLWYGSPYRKAAIALRLTVSDELNKNGNGK